MITSTKNDQIKNIIALQKKARERKAQRLFVVEGFRGIKEVPYAQLKAVYGSTSFWNGDMGHELKEYLRQAKGQFDILVEEVSDDVYSSMSDTVTPQGVLGLVKTCEFTFEQILGEGERTPLVVILESLQDPGNLGTIIRTAEGAGATGIIMNSTTVDIYSPKVVRSTMGSIFRVPHLITGDLPETLRKLQESGVMLYAAHLKGEKFYDELNFSQPCGFLIGNEGNGLTKETADMADAYMKIPMEGQLESLNAAMACGILLYETHRQRK